jgi:hypothetical protein
MLAKLRVASRYLDVIGIVVTFGNRTLTAQYPKTDRIVALTGHKIGQPAKSPRSRYVPVGGDFAVFNVLGVLKNQ